MIDKILISIPIVASLALVVALVKYVFLKKNDEGNDRMKVISQKIRTGAMTFLMREYKILAVFVIVVAALLGFVNHGVEKSSSLIAFSFVLGAFLSALAGFIGMRTATYANVRTTQAAQKSLGKALNIAFNGGAVMGLSVVGFGILGLSGLFIFYFFIFEGEMSKVLNVLTGFSFGASSIALFSRVGGGIFTKAADVGADLVGKVEAGIPEDDPRNPAVIADNVGDNVGDIAGMGADLYESFIGALISAMIIGIAWGNAQNVNPTVPVVLPMFIASIGILASIVGTFFVKVSEGGNPQAALNKGSLIATVIMIVGAWFAITGLLPEGGIIVSGAEYTGKGLFFSVLIGLLVGTAIGFITEYYTGLGKSPVKKIAESSETGTATNIISGISIGMRSTFFPIIIIGIAIIASYHLGGLYAVAMAAVGMLSVIGIQLSIDAYGPIADNAGGIAEMAALDKSVREKTDKLDAVGNTTAAIGKGFAIGSAALTALALFSAFKSVAGIETINLSDPVVVAGILVGAVLPYLFSSLAMDAVAAAASEMIKEVRRQFKEIKGLLEDPTGEKADSDRCVAISTVAALKKMIVPGVIALVAPVLTGLYDVQMLAGLLIGVTSSGISLAIFMSNAGGAWDNAKKYIEDGNNGGKGSEAHKAAVVGDTVGDPFKDTAGPSLNILVKLISVVALVIAPFIV